MAGFELYAPRSASQKRTWVWAVILLCIVFNIIAGIIAAIPYFIEVVKYVAAHPGVDGAHIPKPEVDGVWFLYVPCLLQILFVLGWVTLVERRPVQAIGFNSGGLLKFARGYLIGCGMLAGIVGLIWLCGGYRVEGPGAWAAPTAAVLLPIGSYALAFIVQGSSEEVLMRGWLMQIVASRRGIIIAVIVNSLLFGLAHMFNPSPLVPKIMGVSNVALFGVFISLYACRDRSLWGVCGWHGAWNWLLGIGFGLEVSGLKLHVKPLLIDLVDTPGTPVWLNGGAWGPEASVLTTGILVTGIALLIWRGALKPGDSFAAPSAEAARDSL
ncbi:MAG: CPBP family intramembrane glutamic endopeptidase [Asticcacaulis sp.]